MTLMKQIIKQVWQEVAAIVFFILLSFTYFATPISQGLVVPLDKCIVWRYAYIPDSASLRLKDGIESFA